MLSKVCKCCGVDRPMVEYLVRNKARGTTRTECKSCQAAVRASKKISITEYNKAYHAANRAEMLARNRAYHAANRDEILPRLRERNLERYHSDDAYMAKTLGACAARRAPDPRFCPSWADADAIAAVYQYAKAMRAAGLDMQVDHIVPIKSKLVCGLHVHENLRVITKRENCIKHNSRWPSDMPYASTPYALPL